MTVDRGSLERYADDPLAVRAMNPVFDTFPDSSLIDFSFLLDPPAGKNGYVQVGQDGHFYFSDTGERVRFWGVTVAANHVDIDKERIRTVVDVLARSGCNLLRLHELDNRGGEKYNLVRRNIIDEAYPNNNVSTVLEPEYLDRVDWWIYHCRQKGVYVYLVLRGYRTFRPGDGVAAADQLDRAAKPYAFFDPRLIELQKDYAAAWLFDHVNPYTGVPNGLDPAIAMIEIENEDSLFFGFNWREFIEPYRTEFQRLWNRWLLEEYGSTQALRQAWTNAQQECAVGENESLENATVELPDMSTIGLQEMDNIPWTSPASPARTRDGVRFAASVQEEYFATMRDFLRQRGARMPLTAVVNSLVLADTWTAARQLRTTAENAYLDHPGFQPGQAWVGKQFFSNQNYIKNDGVWSLAPHLARYRWAGTALVCREWTNCWPNEYRASAALEITSLSLMQDYDALIHFAYYTTGNPDVITPFGPQADPPRWGLFGYCAKMFIQGEIEPDPRQVAIAYNNEDLATWASFISPLHRLAWKHRLVNWNPNADIGDSTDDFLVTVVSGRSGTGEYRGDNLVLSDARLSTRRYTPQDAKSLFASSGYDFPWTVRPEGFPVSEVRAAGYVPFLLDESGSMCRGLYDGGRNVVLLRDVGEDVVARVADRMAEQQRQGKTLSGEIAQWSRQLPDEMPVLSALDGSLVRDTKSGLIKIAGRQTCALAGEFTVGQEISAGDLKVSSVSPVGAVVATSLDGLPLAVSRHLALKMVTVAQNRGQRLDKVQDASQRPFVLAEAGSPPVQTLGQASPTPTRVSVGGRLLVEAFLTQGTWEVVIDFNRGQSLVFCDTPNIRFALSSMIFGDAFPTDVAITKYFYEYPPVDAQQTGWDFIYPGYAKYVELKRVAP